jgi:hypothetical protein
MTRLEEQIKKIREDHKSAVEYFWDKPTPEKTHEIAAEYAQLYFKLANKWLKLHDAFNRSMSVIDEQIAIIKEQSEVIEHLHMRLGDAPATNKENA